MMKKYLDSNIFINSVLYNDEKAKKCKEIVLKIAKKEIIGVTSILTWDELVYVVRKNIGKEIAIKEGKKFLMLPNIIFVDANKNIIDKAQELISKYNLKPRDAIHAVSALINDINEIISDDEDFDKIKEIKRISLEKFK